MVLRNRDDLWCKVVRLHRGPVHHIGFHRVITEKIFDKFIILDFLSGGKTVMGRERCWQHCGPWRGKKGKRIRRSVVFSFVTANAF